MSQSRRSSRIYLIKQMEGMPGSNQWPTTEISLKYRFPKFDDVMFTKTGHEARTDKIKTKWI